MKVRSEDTWAEIRRGWESGETGASLARRYEVGLDNLWRRRATESWVRVRGPDPVPEPVEGWDRYGRRKLSDFNGRLEETRALARKLAEALNGGALEGVPLWHVGFVLAWRAERMGPETAAADRDYMSRYDWAAPFWDARGKLAHVEDLDLITLEANREAWREDAGLPEGVALDIP